MDGHTPRDPRKPNDMHLHKMDVGQSVNRRPRNENSPHINLNDEKVEEVVVASEHPKSIPDVRPNGFSKSEARVNYSIFSHVNKSKYKLEWNFARPRESKVHEMAQQML